MGGDPSWLPWSWGKLEAVNEMIKVNGVDLRTINSDGECLIKVVMYVLKNILEAMMIYRKDLPH